LIGLSRRKFIMMMHTAEVSQEQRGEEKKEEESEDTKPPYQETSGRKHHSVCPITLKRFRKPVVGPDGYTYERSAIVKWVERNGTSPMTRQPMRVDQLVPNHSLIALLAELKVSDRSERTKNRDIFQVFVRSIDNKTHVIDINPFGNVRDMKKKISEKTGIPTFEQRLLWGGKQLEDGRSLADTTFASMRPSTWCCVSKVG
jgi:hypothetical protein